MNRAEQQRWIAIEKLVTDLGDRMTVLEQRMEVVRKNQRLNMEIRHKDEE